MRPGPTRGLRRGGGAGAAAGNALGTLKAHWAKRWSTLRGRGHLRRAIGELVPASGVLAEVVLPLALVGLVSAVLAFNTEQSRLEDMVQRQANARLAADPDPEVAVVLVDSMTRSRFGIGADSRAMINCMVERVAAAEPRAIGLDYLFGDHARVPDLVPGFCASGGERLAVPAEVPLVVASMKARSSGYLEEVPPSPAFVDPGRVFHGYAEMAEDRQDGIVRSLHLVEQPAYASVPVTALSTTLWMAAQRTAGGAPRFHDLPQLRAAVARCREGTGDAGCAGIGNDDRVSRIRFLPPERHLRLVSAHALFSTACEEGGVDAPGCVLSALRDRIVLIGSSHAETGDLLRTPLYNDLPFSSALLQAGSDEPELAGVIVHGLAVLGLSQADGFVRPWPRGLSLLVAAAVLLLPILLLPALRWLARRGGVRWSGVWMVLAYALLLVLLGYALYAIAVASMLHGNRLVPLSLLVPALLAGVFLAWALHFIWSRVEALDRNGLASRHGGRFALLAPDAYAALARDVEAGVARRAFCLAIEVCPADADPDALVRDIARLQRDLFDDWELDRLVESGLAVPLLGNFGANRQILLVFPLGGDGRETFDALAGFCRRLARDAARPPRRYPALGPLRVSLALDNVNVLDVPGVVEHGLYAFTGRAFLPRAAAPDDGQMAISGVPAGWIDGGEEDEGTQVGLAPALAGACAGAGGGMDPGAGTGAGRAGGGDRHSG